MSLRKPGVLLLALLASAVSVGSGHAEDAAPFYKGKTITIVVGTSAGGGYDSYARLLGRYLGKHIPGAPDVIVSNMPGGGSKVAAGYVARVAPKDGTFIAAPYATEPLAPILEDKSGLNYDPNKVNYLGSAASDDYLCVVRPDAPATTFEDMFKTQIVMGGVAEVSETGYIPILLNNLLGTKFKVVLGYPGSREIMMAIEKGEINGMCGLGWTSLEAQYPAMLDNGEVKIFLQENNQGLPEVDKRGVPLSISYARNDEQHRILEIINSQEIYSRPYFVATEVPAERLQILRDAFMQTWRDPGLLKDAANIHLDVGPTSGEDVQALLRKVYANPPEILQKAKEAIKLER